jgi:hypothetical protein
MSVPYPNSEVELANADFRLAPLRADMRRTGWHVRANASIAKATSISRYQPFNLIHVRTTVLGLQPPQPLCSFYGTTFLIRALRAIEAVCEHRAGLCF